MFNLLQVYTKGEKRNTNLCTFAQQELRGRCRVLTIFDSFQTYIEMPFMEDIRYFNFAPLFNDVVKPTQEQLDAVDDLIDAMKVDDPT